MIKAGFTFEHPLTKTRTTVLEGAAETKGLGWLLEVTRYSMLASDIAEHLHLTWTETFEIVSGTARYKLDGIEKIAQAGEAFIVDPRHFHVHPWNATADELVYRQRNRFAQPDPAAVQDVLGVLATRAGMARDGKAPANGFGKLLQQAVTARTVIKHGNYMSRPSMAAQKALGATLGLVAAGLGYAAVHPEYVGQ